MRGCDTSGGVDAGWHFRGYSVVPRGAIPGRRRYGNVPQQSLLKRSGIEARARPIQHALQNKAPEPPAPGDIANSRDPLSVSKRFHGRENGCCLLRLDQLEQAFEIRESRLQGDAFDKFRMPTVTM